MATRPARRSSNIAIRSSRGSSRTTLCWREVSLSVLMRAPVMEPTTTMRATAPVRTTRRNVWVEEESFGLVLVLDSSLGLGLEEEEEAEKKRGPVEAWRIMVVVLCKPVVRARVGNKARLNMVGFFLFSSLLFSSLLFLSFLASREE